MITELEDRLREAVDTLKRLPVPDIQRSLTSWPDTVRSTAEAYGYDVVKVRLAPATPDAITRYDEVMGWLLWLPIAAQQILWSRANGLSWRRIARLVGKAPNTCRSWHLAGLHYIVSRIASELQPRKKQVAQIARNMA